MSWTDILTKLLKSGSSKMKNYQFPWGSASGSAAAYISNSRGLLDRVIIISIDWKDEAIATCSFLSILACTFILYHFSGSEKYYLQAISFRLCKIAVILLLFCFVFDFVEKITSNEILSAVIKPIWMYVFILFYLVGFSSITMAIMASKSEKKQAE